MRKHAKNIFVGVLVVMVLIIYLVLEVAPPNAPWIAKERETYDGGATIRFVQEDSPSVQQQIDKLKEIGFSADNVSDEFFLNQLYHSWDERIVEMYPYWLVFTALGLEYDSLNPDSYEAILDVRSSPLQRDEIMPLSDCVFNFMRVHCNTPEHYVYILSQIERISDGQIALQNIESGRVLRIGRLWVSFTLDGIDYKFSIPGSRKRFNPEILTVIGDLAGESSDGEMLFWNGDEQGVHIVYCRKDTLIQLAEQTGINFWGLDDAQIALW